MQDPPLALPGDVPENFAPALDNDGGGNGQGPPLTNPIVVAGYGNNLMLQFPRMRMQDGTLPLSAAGECMFIRIVMDSGEPIESSS